MLLPFQLWPAHGCIIPTATNATHTVHIFIIHKACPYWQAKPVSNLFTVSRLQYGLFELILSQFAYGGELKLVQVDMRMYCSCVLHVPMYKPCSFLLLGFACSFTQYFPLSMKQKKALQTTNTPKTGVSISLPKFSITLHC